MMSMSRILSHYGIKGVNRYVLGLVTCPVSAVSTSVGGVSSLRTSLVQVESELILRLLARLCREVAWSETIGESGGESGVASRLDLGFVMDLGRSFLRLWLLLILRSLSSERPCSESGVELRELERELLASRKTLGRGFFSRMTGKLRMASRCILFAWS
jgi:hypothetical protein